MSNTARAFGIARSIAIYYGVPFRARRLRRLYRPFVAPGSLCFDVGAHAGNRVRCWRQLGARVIALEPQPDFVRLLEMLYGRDAGVTIVPAAVGRAAGRAQLLISERTPTVTTLSADWVDEVRRDPRFKHVRWDDSAEVEVTTLNALIARYGLPQFVKVDVEGYEAEVLAGLDTALPALSFEYSPAARAPAAACIERLAALAEYRYNWSPGESHAFAADAWVDADALRARLASLPDDAPSGDVYATLATARRFP